MLSNIIAKGVDKTYLTEKNIYNKVILKRDCIAEYKDALIFNEDFDLYMTDKQFSLCESNMERKKVIRMDCCRRYCHFYHKDLEKHQIKIREKQCFLCNYIPIRYPENMLNQYKKDNDNHKDETNNVRVDETAENI